jgi:hypothetical protein
MDEELSSLAQRDLPRFQRLSQRMQQRSAGPRQPPAAPDAAAGAASAAPRAAGAQRSAGHTPATLLAAPRLPILCPLDPWQE